MDIGFDTVKRTIAKLKHMGFVIQGNYNKQRFDQTKWYSIDYQAMDEWLSKNPSKRGKSPLVQNAPMEHGNLPQSNRANSANAVGQNPPMQQSILPHSSGADCPNPSVHDAPLQQGSLPHAIQENNQEIKKEINDKRLTNKTNTQKAHPPTARGRVSDKTAVEGEIVDSVELLFDEFWKLYPRKECKAAAKKAWLKLNPDQVLFTVIANALEYRSQTKEWLAEGGRYVPHPASWLNGRRWEDEQNPNNLSQSAVMEQRYSDVRIDGKPLDPVQKKQLEYIEKQMRERQGSEGV